MAIKQQSTEVVEDKQNSLANFITVLEKILEDPNNIPDGPNLTRLCEKIVLQLGKIPEPRDSNSIKTTMVDLPKIHKLFKTLIESRSDNCNNITGACLKALYRLITSPDGDPSLLVATVLQIVKENQIREAVVWILSQSENTSDECIKRGFKRLCDWLRGVNCAPLHLWIKEILDVLRELKRYDILLELAEDNIKHLFLTLVIPAIRSRSKSIVFLILSSIRHTPKIFHAIVPRIPNALTRIKQDIDNKPGNEEAIALFQDLLALVSYLMILFPGYDHLYKDINNFVQLHHVTSSMEIQKYFQSPPWHHEEIPVDPPLLAVNSLKNQNVRVGLQNLGNTCYLNSVIQALLMTKQFSREILNSPIETEFFNKIQLLIGLLIFSERPELDPKGFLPAIKPPDFLPGYQQDSSEFLGYLLDKLHEHEKKIIVNDGSGNALKSEDWDNPESQDSQCAGKDIVIELKNPPLIEENWDDIEDNNAGLKKFATLEDLSNDATDIKSILLNENPNDSVSDPEHVNFIKTQHKIIDNTVQLNQQTLIQKVFGGKISTTYQCFVCQSKSINIDSFRDLQLAFPETETKANDSYSVQSLLDYYCSSEKLEGDNQYFCDQCKSLCDGQRSIHIVEPPKNLILTLKHFRYEKRYHTRQKLLHNVSHDETISLEIRSNVDSNKIYTVKYTLYAAIVHCGMSMDSGHYYTFAASDKTDEWYKFNDSFVSTTSLEELNRMAPPNTPYILFYKMTSSTSAEASSSTLTSNANLSPTRKISSPSKVCGEDQEGAVSKKQCLISNQDVDVDPFDETNKLPEFYELPNRIQDMICKDNNNYRNVQRQLMAKDRNRMFQYKYDKPSNSNDSDDEQPPSNCGGNDLYNMNKFIY